jgi:hypothetical protein
VSKIGTQRCHTYSDENRGSSPGSVIEWSPGTVYLVL